nr:MAG TPA: hypothetical protein [Caudoviricetes sp.]
MTFLYISYAIKKNEVIKQPTLCLTTSYIYDFYEFSLLSLLVSR